MWLFCEIRRKIKLRDNAGGMSELRLSWADGMAGCMPVFETLDDVQEYCKITGAEGEVVEIETAPKTCHRTRPYIRLVSQNDDL